MGLDATPMVTEAIEVRSNGSGAVTYIGTVRGRPVTYDGRLFILDDGMVFDFRTFIAEVRAGLVTFASPQIEAWYAATVQAWTLTLDQRRERLAEVLAYYVQRGARVESRDVTTAIIVSGRPVDHWMHGIISFFTYGLWLPVWFIVAVSGGEKRKTIAVDEFGAVSEF